MQTQEDKTLLLKTIGAQVRALRAALRMTVKEFAERAELSVRFVAQLEAGEANISIAGLARAAAALDRPLSDLIPQGGGGSLRAQIWERIGSCSDDDLRALDGWLAERAAGAARRFVALIGLRGAGKSTIGRLLAKRLRTAFIEIDGLIEREAGLSLGEIFMLHGEEYYRRLERQELAKFFTRRSGCVLATGGSIVTDATSWEMIKERCFTVWLHATPEEFMRRMKRQGDTRPMMSSRSAMAELKAILARRQPLYAEAALTVKTTGKTPEMVLARIMDRVR